jgi:hypothetical protein
MWGKFSSSIHGFEAINKAARWNYQRDRIYIRTDVELKKANRRGNSIVYINQATNNTAVALLYVIATCGSLFFSKIKMMVIFGAANLAILLVVMEVKRYAFTSLWCAYAAVTSVINLAYFWRSHRERPFLYA